VHSQGHECNELHGVLCDCPESEVRDKHADLLRSLPTTDDQWNKLCELNVIQQVFNVCTSPVVQSAWDNGQPLAVHGLIYNLKDGLLKNLTHPLTSLHDFEHYHEVALANGGEAEIKDRTNSEHMHRLSMDQHVAHLSKNVMTFMSFENGSGSKSPTKNSVPVTATTN